MRGVLKIAALFVVLAFAGIGGAYLYIMTYSPDRDRYPVRGIDVSNHQGPIDWARVAADDVSFAIIKATEGGDFIDKSFARNIAGARAAGLAVGAYHFFTFCRPGADQAQSFIATVAPGGVMLPPVVDIEFAGNCKKRPTPDELVAELDAFLGQVEAAFGQPAVIYVIGEALEAYGAALPQRRRWVRSLISHPGHDDWVYWQFHNRGTVAGIDGPVDLNVYHADDIADAAVNVE